MKLSNTYLNKLTNRMLSKQDQSQALKKLAQRRDWKTMVKKCHDKITEEYKFWVSKVDSPSRTARLTSMNRDINFIKAMEHKEAITAEELIRLKEVVTKYNIT